MKFCKDCKWIMYKAQNVWVYYAHPVCCSPHLPLDPVYGRVEVVECVEERRTQASSVERAVCGPDALYFEPKEVS